MAHAVGKGSGAVVALLVVAFGAVGCGVPERGGDPWYVDPLPTGLGGDDLVVQVEEVGGFVEAMTAATRLPTFAVFGDGRAVTPAPVPDIFPGPALPGLVVHRIAVSELDGLARAAVDAGVGDATLDFGAPPVADATSTRITVNTRQGVLVTEVSALSLVGLDDGLTRPQRQARQRLRAYLDTLDPGTTPGDPYAPAEIVAVARPWADDGALPAQPERAWPGPSLSVPAAHVVGLACVVVTGDAAATLRQEATTANALTPWVADGQRWSLGLRPLLPHEHSCADLHV